MSVSRQDTVLIDAPPSEVIAILVDAGSLPDWNPAFSAVVAEEPTTVGRANAIRVRGLLTGELVYDKITASEVAMTIRVPGLVERGTWRLVEGAGGTIVNHAFTQSGALAELLSSSTANVASLRVNRLRDRVARTKSVIG